ncbi:MAG: response regulator [Crocinitomicaceae bacterium]
MSKILIIEDNPDIRASVADVLEFHHYDVYQACNGEEGFELAKNEKPDLVLCDVLMPKLNGWQTFDKFKSVEELKFIPFVFTTALSRIEDMRKGMTLGAEDYITKPFDNYDLINTVKRLLDKHNALQDHVIASNEASSLTSLQAKELQLQEFSESLERAKIVQQATLPSIPYLENLFNPFALMYLPKDTVSGDFYWAKKMGDIKLIAIADCTGHGIPGALMTMACTNMLNFIVQSPEFNTPKSILTKANQLVVDFLHSEANQLQDGMDISLCAIDSKNKKIHYVGAQRPLFIMSENDKVDGLNPGEFVSYETPDNSFIHKIKGGRYSIGVYYDDFELTEHVINYSEGDVVYMFSDGITDQFGGVKGKKFNTKRLIELLTKVKDLSMENQQRVLNCVFEEWKGDNEQIDDVTLIGIKL